MLHAKYECCSPYGLSQEDFTRFPSLFPCKIGCALAEPKCDHRSIIFTIFVKDHQIMLSSDNAITRRIQLQIVRCSIDSLKF